MAVALALISAVMYGVSDFIGGRASRRSPAVAIALSAELVMLAICLLCVPLLETESPSQRAVFWGLIAGVTGSMGVLGLYIALARGNMTLVAPVTGVVAAVVPVGVGVALGERPGALALVGVVVAIVAVGLIGGAADAISGRASGEPVEVGTVVLAIAVGIAFGLLFVSYSRTGDSGLWPILFSRFTGLPLLALAYLVMQRGQPTPSARSLAAPALTIGVLIAGSNITYLISTRKGMLSVVAVVVAMYPASTVLLASIVDGERPTRSQVSGMILAGVALVMITAGN